MVSTFSVDTLRSIDSTSYDINQIANDLNFESVEKMFEAIKALTKDDFAEYIRQPGFRDAYHSFLYKITELANSINSMTLLNIGINNNIKEVKILLSECNKRKKEHPEIYGEVYKLLKNLEANQSDIENKRLVKYESGNALVFHHIINDIGNIDAVYYYISNHPDIVNLTYEDEPFIVYIMRKLFNSINNMNEVEIEYYKRVITAMILSDSIKIDKESYEALKKEVMFKLSKNDKNKKHYYFIKYLLEKFDRYDLINPHFSLVIPKRILDGRLDLRSLPTITIDFYKRFNGTKLLLDDAFSIEENKDGTTTLYVHVPDVDDYIKDIPDLNDYIKSVSQSRYVENNKLPMIPHNVAGKMSLLSNRDTACITFMIKIDKKGNILSTDFVQSIVSVDTNLSINKAENIIRQGNGCAALLNDMFTIARSLKRKRKAKRDKRSKSGTIMDEFNIWTNIATASFFNDNHILFPYKNILSYDPYKEFQEDVDEFIMEHELDNNASNLLKEIVNTRARYFYSINNRGNSHYNGLPYGTVGNPLREYMSLETARLIKSLIINKDKTEDDLREAIENDCIEQTELQARVKDLYKTTK